MTSARDVVKIRFPIALPVVCALVLFILFWSAALSGFRPLLLVFALLTALTALYSLSYKVEVNDHCVRIERFGRVETIPVETISAVRTEPGHLILVIGNRKVKIWATTEETAEQITRIISGATENESEDGEEYQWNPYRRHFRRALVAGIVAVVGVATAAQFLTGRPLHRYAGTAGPIVFLATLIPVLFFIHELLMVVLCWVDEFREARHKRRAP